MNLSVLMTYNKITNVITYLVSLETREVSYLFNMNKHYKDEDTPRHISVEIQQSQQFSKSVFYVFKLLRDFQDI